MRENLDRRIRGDEVGKIAVAGAAQDRLLEEAALQLMDTAGVATL